MVLANYKDQNIFSHWPTISTFKIQLGGWGCVSGLKSRTMIEEDLEITLKVLFDIVSAF
jgi:hypothetical protein